MTHPESIRHRLLTRITAGALLPTIIVSLALWIATLLLFGSDYPFHYDSINYALGIADDFDIGKCQPHAYGYIYHILSSRIWLPFIESPFRIQQAQNVLYFIIAIFFMIPGKPSSATLLLIPATLPITLFLVATGMIHGVSFAASAIIAHLIVKLEKRTVSPVVLAVVFAIVIGFRQDLAIFLGPVVFIACIRYRCSVRQWIIMVLSGAVLTSVWYVGTSWSSGWLSPWKEANAMVKIFLPGTSLLYGAPLHETIRILIRLFLYIPGVFGPGGLLIVYLALRKSDGIDKLYLAAATAPFFIYGILLYLGMPNYYATITGFIFGWILLRTPPVIDTKLVLPVVVINLLFFLLVPAPLTKHYGTFSGRPPALSVLKQLSYIGAVGKNKVVREQGFGKFLDETVRQCGRFSSAGNVEFEGLPYYRIWGLLARRMWHNTYAGSDSSACCSIRPVKPDETPDKQFDSIGFWKCSDTSDE